MEFTQQHIDEIVSILSRHFPNSRFLLFGSRAAGTAKPFSDIDIAIDCPEEIQSFMLLGDAKSDLIESDLPFVVDLILLNKVDDNFKKIILDEAVELSEALSSKQTSF